MKRPFKIAAFGLMTGAVVALAAPLAMARDGGPGHGDRMGGFGPAPMAKTFAELDVNGDAQITEDDLRALAEARFGESDTDGNGSITLEEVTQSVIAKFQDRMANSNAPEGKGPSEEQIQARAEQMAARIIDRADKDGNGTIEASEMEPANGYGRFIDRMDTDDDNAVSKAEYDEAKQEFGQRMERGGKFGHGERGEKFGRGERGEHGGKYGHGEREGRFGHGDRDGSGRGGQYGQGERGAMGGQRPPLPPVDAPTPEASDS